MPDARCRAPTCRTRSRSCRRSSTSTRWTSSGTATTSSTSSWRAARCSRSSATATRSMRESGYGWPIVDLRLKYSRPATFNQPLVVRAEIVEWENRLKMDYVIRDAATGDEDQHRDVDPGGRGHGDARDAVRLPARAVGTAGGIAVMRRCCARRAGGAALAAPACRRGVAPPAADAVRLVHERLKIAPVLKGEFEQTKTLKGFRNPLVSHGRVPGRARAGRVVAHAAAVRVARWSSRKTRLFTRNADGSASNLVDAQAEPGLQQVNELIFSLLAADLDALADKFDVVAQPVGAAGWTLVLTPRDPNIAQVPRARDARGRARRADRAHRGGARRRHADPLLAPGAVRGAGARRGRALQMSVGAAPRPVRRLRWQVAAWAWLACCVVVAVHQWHVLARRALRHRRDGAAAAGRAGARGGPRHAPAGRPGDAPGRGDDRRARLGRRAEGRRAWQHAVARRGTRR